MTSSDPPSGAAIVVFPLPSVGDFVRCHTLIQLLRQRHPGSPVDIVGRKPAIEIAPLLAGVRRGIPEPFAHNTLDMGRRLSLAATLRSGGYRTAYIISRSWKAGLVPFLARIPERIGWFGEGRLIILNRLRFGDLAMPRMVDRIGALALDAGEDLPPEWPAPQIIVPPDTLAAARRDLPSTETGARILAIAPGSSDAAKNWPAERFADLVRWATGAGWTVWLLGAQHEAPMVQHVRTLAGGLGHDLTNASLLTSTCYLAAADAFVGNDSGPLHIAAALGKPSVGIFTFTHPFYSAPINANARFVVASPRRVRATFNTPQPPELEAVVSALEDVVQRTQQDSA
jgi:heptosyltransferase-2